MLRGIQKASTGRIGKTIMTIILGALALSFVVWGIGDIFRGFGRSALAKVGNTEIPIEQFRQLYTEKMQELSRQIGRPVTMEQARGIGYDRQVLGQLIGETVLDERAKQLGLNISDAEVANSITNDPIFRSPGGGFDRSRFEAILRQASFTEPRYVAEHRRQILRRQIVSTIAGDVTVPKVALEAAHRYANEERSIDYVVLDRSQAGSISPPSPEVLTKYFEDRRNQFRAPEYRKVVVVSVVPDEMEKWITVDEAEAKRIYEQRIARYTVPEQRHVQQMVFQKPEDAQAAADRIAQGAKFEAVAKERGLQEADIDLGTIQKSTIIDPAVADAAFALKEGEVSAPVKGRFGTTLVRVLKIAPGQVRPFDQVSQEIKHEIAHEQAKAQIAGLRDKLEDARAGGDTLAEAAEKLKLAVTKIDAVDRAGQAPNGLPVNEVRKSPELLNAIFSTDVGVENDPLQYESGFIWYDVTGITPARERSLDEVKNELEIRWTNDEIASRLKTKGEAMLEKLKAGATLKDVAAADKLKVETANVKRGDPTETLGTPTVNAVFHTPKDSAGSAEGVQATQRVVFRVTDVKVPSFDANSEEAKRLSETLRGALTNELLAGYAERLEKEIGVTINTGALSQVVGGGSTN